MEKQITIEIPEGYSDVIFNKDKNKLEFIKSIDKPKNWEEYCKNYPHTGNEYYFNIYYVQKSLCKKGEPRKLSDIAYSESKEELDAFVALMKLMQLRKAWVGDWKLPTEKDSTFWSICNCTDRGLVVRKWYYSHTSMVFSTYELGKEFLDCHKELLKKAKIFL